MRGRTLGVRMPVEDEDADEPWRMTPSRRPKVGPISGPLSGKITIVVADQLYIDRTALPAATTARLMRLAAFQNPEFYRAQSMRFQTFGKPRVVSCAQLHRRHVGLRRGCLDEAVELIRGEGAEVELNDLRVIGNPLASRVRFQGTLAEPQVRAFEALLPHENGVRAATTAFGKTVVAAALIAKRGCNALVLIHRRELLAQWVERLRTFLEIDPKDIGVIGSGRRKPTGTIDAALIQSLVRRGEVADLVADYGHLVVDECHHLSAASFELVPAGRKRAMSSDYPRRWPAKMVIIRSSSCNAALFGIVLMPVPMRPGGDYSPRHDSIIERSAIGSRDTSPVRVLEVLHIFEYRAVAVLQPSRDVTR